MGLSSNFLARAFGIYRLPPLQRSGNCSSERTSERGRAGGGHHRHAVELHQDPGFGFWTDRAIGFGWDGYDRARRYSQCNGRRDVGWR